MMRDLALTVMEVNDEDNGYYMDAHVTCFLRDIGNNSDFDDWTPHRSANNKRPLWGIRKAVRGC